MKWLHNVKDPSSRLLRWRLRLEEYTYIIKYVRGKENKAADCLSRVFPVQQLDLLQKTLDSEEKNQTTENAVLNSDHDSDIPSPRKEETRTKLLARRMREPSEDEEMVPPPEIEHIPERDKRRRKAVEENTKKRDKRHQDCSTSTI